MGVGVAVAVAGPGSSLGLEAGEDGVEALIVLAAPPGVPGRLGGGRVRCSAVSYPRYTVGADGYGDGPVPVPVLVLTDRNWNAENTTEEKRDPRLLDMIRACEASSKKTDASEEGKG